MTVRVSVLVILAMLTVKLYGETKPDVSGPTESCTSTKTQQDKKADDTDSYRAMVGQHSAYIKQLQTQMRAVETKLSHKVAFSAHFSKASINFTDVSRLVFDAVSLNLGNGYEPSTGFFRAPYAGVYLFHIKLLSFENFAARLDIITTPHTLIASTEVWADRNRQVATAQSAVYLNVGQTVCVAAVVPFASASNSIFYGEVFTSFGGYLLYSD